jgi:hypothetical protein
MARNTHIAALSALTVLLAPFSATAQLWVQMIETDSVTHYEGLRGDP